MPFAARLLLRLAVNAGALWIANALWDGVAIHGWAAYLIGAAVLAIANAVIKPVLALLTLPLILATLGLFYFVLNVAMVALAEWIAPHFAIDGFWSYVGVVLILWIVNWAVHRIVDDLGGRNRPRGRFTMTMERRR